MVACRTVWGQTGGFKDVQNILPLASKVVFFIHISYSHFFVGLCMWVCILPWPLSSKMSQNCDTIHVTKLSPATQALPVACAISKYFMFNKSSTQVQSAHLSHFQILPAVSSISVVSLQPPTHLIKIGGLTPISLNHLSSWFCGPPICASNLSLVSLKCQCGGASMYLLAMDFPWNVPFSVYPVACFDRQ